MKAALLRKKRLLCRLLFLDKSIEKVCGRVYPITFRGFTLFLFVGIGVGKLIKKNGNQIK